MSCDRRTAIRNLALLGIATACLVACKDEKQMPSFLSEFELEELTRISPRDSNPAKLFVPDAEFGKYNAAVVSLYRSSRESSNGVPMVIPGTVVQLGESVAMLTASRQLREFGREQFKILLPGKQFISVPTITGEFQSKESGIEVITLDIDRGTLTDIHVAPIPIDQSPWEPTSETNIRIPTRTIGTLYRTGQFAGVHSYNDRLVSIVQSGLLIGEPPIGHPVFDMSDSDRLVGIVTSVNQENLLMSTIPNFPADIPPEEIPGRRA